jgi:hypothetical protein
MDEVQSMPMLPVQGQGQRCVVQYKGSSTAATPPRRVVARTPMVMSGMACESGRVYTAHVQLRALRTPGALARASQLSFGGKVLGARSGRRARRPSPIGRPPSVSAGSSLALVPTDSPAKAL